MARARNFCFTLNNYTSEEEEVVKNWECKYLIFGKEQGESGTPHLQGYVCFANQKTLTTLKKYSDRAHWEIARGTPKQASEYCQKDGDVFEKGERPLSQAEKGKKNADRWQEAFQAVLENRLEDVPADIKCVHLKSIEYAVKRERQSKRKLDTLDGPLEHEWLVGDTGAGKTRLARAENPGHYLKDPTTKWWDGYDGEDTVIIDDFDKFQVKQGGDMKRWLDRYPVRVEFKGGYELIRPKKVIVTSQYTPEEIWDDQKTVDAINRRVRVRRVVEGPFSSSAAVAERAPPIANRLPAIIFSRPPDPAGAGRRHAGGASDDRESRSDGREENTLGDHSGSPGRLEFMEANGW